MTSPGEQPEEVASQEVVLVINPVAKPVAPTGGPLFGLVAVATGLVGAVASTLEQTVVAGVNAALDRVVPIAVNAVVDRLDLTQIVLDRVDIDAIVAKANMEEIIDRVPMVAIADYIVTEIDLPKIIRESTGGVATDALNAARLQALSVDDLINKVADSMLFRRRGRNIESPMNPTAGQDS